ncbi:DgyrCDS10450 [Dimorphilus gyrociliatus]|uniref:L-aminoadipate-semialdehyde dehydrogenase-phosphopantetheinyl transferase n=1 Tax=Dimorphilus gyrociliatus TaxID=2664684 RepID=A0A7I8W1F3_9ANNE|nr:DgyrCDS10450 [Dimorphilus gyrociliatus]
MSEPGVRFAWKISTFFPTKDQWIRALRCIQSEERERIAKFHYQVDAISSMAGRLLMRKIIRDHFGVSNSEIKLSRTEKGKPVLDMPKNNRFSFNVSHHGDYVIAAAQVGSPIGVDIMTIDSPSAERTVKGYINLMSKQFSKDELDALNSYEGDSQKMEHFYRLWCLKESYVKAVGVGITIPLHEIEFSTPVKRLSTKRVVGDTKFFIKGSLKDQWTFEESKLDINHVACVATVGNERVSNKSLHQAKFSEVNFDDVVEELENCNDELNDEEIYWEKFSGNPRLNVNKADRFCGCFE